MDYGKKFEQDFIKSLKGREEVSIDRLYDTAFGFSGVANICDLIVYRYPIQVYLELKSVTDNVLDIGNILEGKFRNISQTQYEGLLGKTKYRGVHAGIVVEYRMEKRDCDRLHYYIPIKEIRKMAEDGRKSINQKNIDTYDTIEIYSEKIRTRYSHNINLLLKELAMQDKLNQ